MFVGVVGAEDAFVAQVAPCREQALADVRLEARVHERDPPVLDVGAQQLDIAAPVGQHEVIGQRLVAQVALDSVGLVAEAEDKVVQPQWA